MIMHVIRIGEMFVRVHKPFIVPQLWETHPGLIEMDVALSPKDLPEFGEFFKVTDRDNYPKQA